MSIALSSVREPNRKPVVAVAASHFGLPIATLVTLLAASTPLWAQSPQDAAASADATNAQNGAAGIDQLQEVTVTAERVATSELRTPISITAISPAQLQQTNIRTPTDLKGLVPSLNIVQQGSYGNNESSIYIRGVGSAARFFNQDLAVGVYLDDIYFPTTQNLNLSFYDLQSVQILKGPQGTLFGRNTLGGAVLLETAPPGNQFGGYAQATIGTFARLDTEGAVNMPFSDTLTSRLSFHSSDVNGYINHVLDDGKNDDIHEKAARYQLRFHPGSVFTADLMGEYGESHDNGNEAITVACNNNAAYTRDYAIAHPGHTYCGDYPPLGQKYTVWGNSVQKFPSGLNAYGQNPDGTLFVLGPSGLNSPGGRTPYDDGKMGTLALRMSWNLSNALTLKSITGLRRSDLNRYYDDGTPAGLYTELVQGWDRNWSQEVQALVNVWGGRLNLVAGLFYFHDTATTIQDTGPDYDDPVGYYYANNTLEKSEAAYVQATLALTSKLNLIAGFRATQDQKGSDSKVWEGCYLSYAEELATGTGGCWIPGPSFNDVAAASGTWRHNDPRLQFQYQWTPEVMSYISATSGYLAGGFNAQLPYFPPAGVPANKFYNTPFQQETLWDYEFGTKGEWFNHRLRVDFDAYDQIFDNIQSGVLQYYNGIDVTTTTSAADGHQRGVELAVAAIPVTNLTLQASYSYLTQGYDTIFPGARGLSKKAALTSAPNKQYSLVANYTFHLANGGTIVPAANWRYVGQQHSGTYPLQYLEPGYALLGLNLNYNSPNGRWSAGLWGTNVTDKYYFNSYASYKVPNTNMGDQQIVPGRPREVGATFRYTF